MKELKNNQNTQKVCLTAQKEVCMNRQKEEFETDLCTFAKKVFHEGS